MTYRYRTRMLAPAAFCALTALFVSGLGAGAATPRTAPAGPRAGGTIHVAFAGSAVSLDPTQAYTSDWWFINGTLFNGLYQLDRNGTPQLDLAAGPPTISADRRVWTFRVRKGVLFHNGREVTAEDLAFSITRALDPHLKPAVSWGQTTDEIFQGAQAFVAGKATSVSGIQVLDRYTIRFVLAQPVAVFPYILAQTYNMVVPKAVVQKVGDVAFANHPIGTGPFMLHTWDKSTNRVVVVRNPHYFHSGKPHLDTIIADFNVASSLIALKIEKGELTGAGTDGDVAAPDLQQARNDPRYARYLVAAPIADVNWLDVNVHVAPLDKLAVRQAIAMAINRKRLVRLLGGQALPATQFYIPVEPQHDPLLDQHPVYPYDPPRAAALIKASGYHGEPITLLYSTGGSGGNVAVGLQQDLQQIGLHVALRGVTGGSLFALIKPFTGHQLSLNDWSATFPDGYDIYSGVLACGSNANGAPAGAHYCNADADGLVTAAESMALGAARTALLRRAQVLNLQAASRVPLYFAKPTEMVSPQVGGFYYEPIFGWQYENYWLKH